MDAQNVANRHAAYYSANMPNFLRHKPPERIAAAVEWTGAYCRDVLPGLLIDRGKVRLQTEVGVREQH